MTAATLHRGGQALLSDQSYQEFEYETRSSQRSSAPPITMDASEPFTIRFGSEGFFHFDEMPPTWFVPVLMRICRLGDLPINWNTYGAQRVDPHIAAHAVNVLLATLTGGDPLPSVVPTSRGGLMFEWHIGEIDLEVDVISPSSVYVAMEVDGNDEEFENASLELIQEKVGRLRSRY